MIARRKPGARHAALLRGLIFPPKWKLYRAEEAMLVRLASHDGPVAIASLERDRIRARGPVGRPVRVHICYLRKKLAPHGVKIETVYDKGYALTPEAREIVRPFLPAPKNLRRGM